MNERGDAIRVGLALGSGASRGWSHIGVLKALQEADIVPDVICGTSVGAMVGASYAAGNLEKLEQWVLGASRSDVLGFFSVRFEHTAFVDLARMDWFLHNFVASEVVRIEDLKKTYAAICTDLSTGREVWLREGSLARAVSSSMAMPGLFPPVRDAERWLVDGGLVNPVPVAACRALGADVVIGVNLNADILLRYSRKHSATPEERAETVLSTLKKQAKQYSSALFPSTDDRIRPPSVFSTISQSIGIFQDQITRSRLAGDPADVLVSPRVGDIGMLEFQRAGEAIEKGYQSVQKAVPEILGLLQGD